VSTRPWEKTEIADRFKALRRKARLTQRYLGRLIGVDRKTVNRIENQRSKPQQKTWDEFCELEATHNEPDIMYSKDWLRELRELADGLACRN
jgi:DNA-binding XRE family transcriptional regulator